MKPLVRTTQHRCDGTPSNSQRLGDGRLGEIGYISQNHDITCSLRKFVHRSPQFVVWFYRKRDRRHAGCLRFDELALPACLLEPTSCVVEGNLVYPPPGRSIARTRSHLARARIQASDAASVATFRSPVTSAMVFTNRGYSVRYQVSNSTVTLLQASSTSKGRQQTRKMLVATDPYRWIRLITLAKTLPASTSPKVRLSTASANPRLSLMRYTPEPSTYSTRLMSLRSAFHGCRATTTSPSLTDPHLSAITRSPAMSVGSIDPPVTSKRQARRTTQRRRSRLEASGMGVGLRLCSRRRRGPWWPRRCRRSLRSPTSVPQQLRGSREPSPRSTPWRRSRTWCADRGKPRGVVA